MKVIVLDTETVGKVTQTLLNVGWQVVEISSNGDFKVLAARDYLIGALYRDTMLMINDTFVGAAKYGKYVELVKNKKIITKTSHKQILKQLEKDIEKYNVEYTYAYNNRFDLDKIEKTSAQLGVVNPLEKTKNLDLWGMASALICDTAEYLDWARENDILTATGGYVSTSVESVVKFLSGNLDFEEDHTALSDVTWETSILKECYNKVGARVFDSFPKAKLISSKKLFKEKITKPNGEVVEIEYYKKYTRDGVTYYR